MWNVTGTGIILSRRETNATSGDKYIDFEVEDKNRKGEPRVMRVLVNLKMNLTDIELAQPGLAVGYSGSLELLPGKNGLVPTLKAHELYGLPKSIIETVHHVPAGPVAPEPPAVETPGPHVTRAEAETPTPGAAVEAHEPIAALTNVGDPFKD